MTFIRARAGFLHLAVLLDLFSRTVGWAMSARPNLAAAFNALHIDLAHGRSAEGLVDHTDRGQLYRVRAYPDMLSAHRVNASIALKEMPTTMPWRRVSSRT